MCHQPGCILLNTEQYCENVSTAVVSYLIPLVVGAWRVSMWWGRAISSSGPVPSHSHLKVMVAWSPDELALTLIHTYASRTDNTS
jgi:hypothetical protein